MTNFEKHSKFFENVSLGITCDKCPAANYCRKYGVHGCLENFVFWANLDEDDDEEEEEK